MSRTRIKICGITSVRDARRAVSGGADALGLNFYAPSVRCVAPSRAREIVERLPPFVTAVGLFVNPEAGEVEATVAVSGVHCLQFHGDEDPAFCASFGLPYIKALRIREGTDVFREAARYEEASALLLDTWHKTQAGGTGECFDWELAVEAVRQLAQPVILAGGLHAGNVADAIQRVKPYAVDVSSGVEVTPGAKDPDKLAKFFRGVYSAQ